MSHSQYQQHQNERKEDEQTLALLQAFHAQYKNVRLRLPSQPAFPARLSFPEIVWKEYQKIHQQKDQNAYRKFSELPNKDKILESKRSKLNLEDLNLKSKEATQAVGPGAREGSGPGLDHKG